MGVAVQILECVESIAKVLLTKSMASSHYRVHTPLISTML